MAIATPRGVARLQAVFRGQRSRKLHVERVKKDLAWAPFVPCSLEAAQAMLHLANVSSDDVVLDIGCGDGRVVFEAIKPPFSAKQAIGVDIDPALVAQCQRSPQATVKTTFILDDWIHIDMSHVTVITLFFLPHESIARLLAQKCRPGTRVVTYVFSIQEWTPQMTATTVPFLKESGDSPLFLYYV
ncbi:hypothetical protein AC1031_003891 [Aphanomyces cochlioides]|nr:hypothetical protein AC1031_003891 [Aphanomyces cochlioides]